jgi:hypothetical protein
MSGLVVFLIFVVALGLAAQFGWATDSRDGADWRQSDAGERVASGARR